MFGTKLQMTLRMFVWPDSLGGEKGGAENKHASQGGQWGRGALLEKVSSFISPFQYTAKEWWNKKDNMLKNAFWKLIRPAFQKKVERKGSIKIEISGKTSSNTFSNKVTSEQRV